MLLVELGLQGIVGFSGIARIGLKPGLNVGRIADADARRTVLQSLFHLLFPEQDQNEMMRKLAADGVDSSRIVLTYQGRDNATYRLHRDVKRGAALLQKFDPQPRTFQTMSETMSEVAQFLRVQESMPDQDLYRRLFMFHRDLRRELSRKPGAAEATASGSGGGAPAPAPIAPGMRGGLRAPTSQLKSMAEVSGRLQSVMRPGTLAKPAPKLQNALLRAEQAQEQETEEATPLAPTPPKDPEELRAELAKLLERVAGVRSLDADRTKLDRLIQRRTELTEQTAALRKIENDVIALKKDTEGDIDLAQLPEGMATRIRSFEHAKDKRDLEMKRLNEERLQTQQQIEDAIRPLREDRYFVGGVSSSVMSIGLAIALEYPLIALANILGAAVAAGGIFRYIGDLEDKARLNTRLATIADREGRIEKQYELETGIVRRLMEQLAITEPTAILERIESAEGRQSEIAKLEREFAEGQRAGGLHEALDELKRVEDELNELELRVADVEATAATIDMKAIERRIAAIERDLEGEEPADLSHKRIKSVDPEEGLGASSSDGYDLGYGSGYELDGPSGYENDGPLAGLWAMSHGDDYPRPKTLPGRGGGMGGSEPPATAAEEEDPTVLAVQAGADAFRLQLDVFTGALAPRMGQYLNALSLGAYTAAKFSSKGAVLAATTADAEGTPFFELRPAVAEVVEIATQLAVVEACVSRLKLKVPLLIDDPLATLEEQRRKLFRQMIGHLSTTAQLVVLTPNDDLKDGHMLPI